MKTLLCLYLAILSASLLAQHLEVKGAIQISGSESLIPPPGTIQWHEKDFKGFDGTQWRSLTAFNPGFPTYPDIHAVVLLDSITSYSVPVGYNFFVTSMKFSQPFMVNGIPHGGIYSLLDGHLTFALGDGMTITTTDYISMNGFLVEAQEEFVVVDFTTNPYTVPEGKILFISTLTSQNIRIDGVLFPVVSVVFSQQTITGEGSLIGYLK